MKTSSKAVNSQNEAMKAVVHLPDSKLNKFSKFQLAAADKAVVKGGFVITEELMEI